MAISVTGVKDLFGLVKDPLLGRVRRLFSPPEPAPEPLPDGSAERPFPWQATYPEGITWDREIAPRPLTDLLDDGVARFPQRPAMEFLGKRYTYRLLADMVDRVARGLQDIGVGPGVRVGLFLPNCPYYVIAYYAILRAGGTVVNFNPLHAEREIHRQIEDSDTRLIVTLDLATMYPKVAARLDDSQLERLIVCHLSDAMKFGKRAFFKLMRRKEVANIPQDERHVRFARLLNHDKAPRPVPVNPRRDIALVQYTGGTTGTPKGAELTHANLYVNTIQTAIWSAGAVPGEERVLGVLPLFHVFGMTTTMNVGLHLGAEIVLLPRFKLQEVLRVIHRQKPTVFCAVPTMYAAINECKELDKFDLSSLTHCISGGAPLPVRTKKRFESLTGCTLVEGYGLTEAAPVVTINPFEGVNKAGSIGMPVPGTVVEIISLDDPDQVLPMGMRGEICVRGPQVMRGYRNQEEESTEALRGGRLRTGDVGYMDQQGYVYLIDRVKDLILNGGFNVYPRQVEEAIRLHPDVGEVTVAGVPDAYRGEQVKAFVVPRPDSGLTVAALRAFLKDKLAPYELPKKYDLRDTLPETFLGKPDRRALVAEEIRRLNDAGPGHAVAAEAGAQERGSDAA